MPDFCDRAAAEYEEHFRRSLDRQAQKWADRDQESATHCRECGCEIPEARRKAVPGVVFCVQCQEAHDA